MGTRDKTPIIECFKAYKKCYDRIQLLINTSPKKVRLPIFMEGVQKLEEELAALFRDFRIGTLKCTILCIKMYELEIKVKESFSCQDADRVAQTLTPIVFGLEERLLVCISQRPSLKITPI